MEHPVGRALRVLELLQTYGRVTGPDLAVRLEVDIRTVRHYVTRLQEVGIPVVADRGRAGGYRLRPGFKLPPLMFTNDEALAVTLGLLAVRRFGLLAGGDVVDGALAKVDRVLPDALRHRLQAAGETLALATAERTPEPVDGSLLVRLGDAARTRRRVRIRYRSWRGEVTERKVDPYGLVFNRGRWYLAGRDHLRAAVRTFRLDRMASADATREEFERPAGFDAADHVLRGLSVTPFRWAVEVVLELPEEEARLRVPPEFGTIEPVEGGVLVRMRAERLDGAARYLASLGCAFTVREPAELLREVRELGSRLVALAGRPQPA
jgi:predicted DNA-binding transcriptional regulator YafY